MINIYHSNVHLAENQVIQNRLFDQYLDDLKGFADRLRIKEQEITTELLEEIGKKLEDSDDPEVKKLSDQLKDKKTEKKTKFEKLADFCDKGSKIAGFGEKLQKYWPAIALAVQQYGPVVWEFLNTPLI